MNIKTTMAQQTIENLLSIGSLQAALDACRDSLKEARSEQDQQLEVMALIGLAQVHQYYGRFRDAPVYADGAIKAAKKLDIPELIVMALNTSASVFFTCNFQIDEAEADYRAALQLAHETENKEAIATALCGIAAVFNHAHEHTRAVTYAREAFDFARDENAYFVMATALGIMGNGFIKLDQYEKALKAFDDALVICEEHNIKLLQGYLIGNKGLLMTADTRYYDEGLELLDRALTMAQNIQCAPHEFAALHMLGMTRMDAGQFDLAQDYYETMLTRSQTWKNRAYEGVAFYELGRLHIRAEQYDAAQANFEETLIISRETMNPFYEAQTEAALGMTFALKFEYEQALTHYMAARTLYDALEDDSRMRDMTRAIILTYINRLVDQVLRFFGIRREAEPLKHEVDENDDLQPLT